MHDHAYGPLSTAIAIPFATELHFATATLTVETEGHFSLGWQQPHEGAYFDRFRAIDMPVAAKMAVNTTRTSRLLLPTANRLAHSFLVAR
jgi:hypothetical protein